MCTSRQYCRCSRRESGTDSSPMRTAQLGQPVTGGPGVRDDVDCSREQVDDLVVASESSEVLEGEVDRVHHGPGAAQDAKLVELSLSARQLPTIGRDHDRLKGGYRSVTRVKP